MIITHIKWKHIYIFFFYIYENDVNRVLFIGENFYDVYTCKRILKLFP